VIGKRPPAAVEKLRHDKSVEVLGFVDDLSSYMEKCAAFVVPLRIGGGMRVKILSAMAWQLPVVSTAVGAEGIQASDNKNILIRNDPRSFAEAVLDLLSRVEFRKEISLNARKFVEEKYSWDVIYRELDRVFQILKK
jgi:glycosyltransferase involved in cell wall biosynthesis